MTEELDLLNAVAGKSKTGARKRAKFEASIVTTFNAYLPFYEDVVLRRFVASGCQHNVLLLDRGDLFQSLSAPTARPRLAGRAYTLVPMWSAGAFHPKMALLVGRKRARVFVGSHNVTLSGFGYNRELTTQIDLPNGSEDPNAPLAQAVWRYLEAWLQHQDEHIPQSILEATQRVATRFSPWLKEEMPQSGDIRFVGALPEGESLWGLVRPMLPKKAQQVLVLGPFFDRSGGFLGTLVHDLQATSVVVGVEPDTVELCRREGLVEGVRFVDATSMGRGAGYLHAKALWVEGEAGDAALITGSANPSSPAWTEDSSKRNAEAVLVHLGETARVLANTLGITSIPSMPELGSEALRAIAERIAQTPQEGEKSKSTTVMAAEAIEGAIFLHCPGITAVQVKTVRCWNSRHGSWRDEQTIRYDDRGVYVEMASEELAATVFLEVDFLDGRCVKAFVHHPAAIAKLTRTSTQQRFQEALNSLDSESPDLPTVIRLANNLIFDEEISEEKTKLIKVKQDREGTPEHDKSLSSLSVSIEETKQHSRRARQLRASDLAYIIDILIYRLGLGLRSAVELLEETGPSEEERVGTDDEDLGPAPKKPPKIDIAKTCHRKIRTLVSRMLKQFGREHGGELPAHRPVEQLLALLAVLREVRAQDHRMSQHTEGQSLVPLEERRRLLDGSLTALFGDKQRLYRAAVNAFEEDPEDDLSRLIGLLVWLVWDSNLDARTAIQRIEDREDTYAGVHELAELVQVFLLADRYNAAIEEAERSIWRTAGDGEKGSASRWLKFHCDWGRALTDLFESHARWPARGREAKSGDVAVAIRETLPTLRVVLRSDTSKVHMVEPGDPTKKIAYLKNFVAIADMPSVPEP